MRVQQLVPHAGEVELEQALEVANQTCRPFAPQLVEFCSGLSSALMHDFEARALPELQALAFWLRRAAVAGMRREFEALQSGDCVLVPRGLVFHIPPANVDTIFLYSWALSFLTGNSNVIRLSSKESRQSAILLRLLQSLVQQAGEALHGNTVVLRYGHDEAITEAISFRSDVRIVWGGNQTVGHIRQARLPPHAKELTFPDRTSLAAFKSGAWLALAEPAKQQMAEYFYNDTYWFDQMACSSPHLVVWCGAGPECREASQDFLERLCNHIRRKGYSLATGTFLKKLAFSYGAILDAAVCDYAEYANELTVLTLDTLKGLSRDHCGGGLFYQVFMRSLDELIDSIERPHQTLCSFGFNKNELQSFVRQLNGKGIDRIVPIGDALKFTRLWDGYDLLQELTRKVYISPCLAVC